MHLNWTMLCITPHTSIFEETLEVTHSFTVNASSALKGSRKKNVAKGNCAVQVLSRRSSKGAKFV